MLTFYRICFIIHINSSVSVHSLPLSASLSHVHYFFSKPFGNSQFQYSLEAFSHNNSTINTDMVILSHLLDLNSYFTNCSTSIFIEKFFKVCLC